MVAPVGLPFLPLLVLAVIVLARVLRVDIAPRGDETLGQRVALLEPLVPQDVEAPLEHGLRRLSLLLEPQKPQAELETRFSDVHLQLLGA